MGLDDAPGHSEFRVVSRLGVLLFGALTTGAVFVEVKDLVGSGDASRAALALVALLLDAGWIGYLVLRRSHSGNSGCPSA